MSLHPSQATHPNQNIPRNPDHAEKHKPGDSWNAGETQILPKNHLGIVCFCHVFAFSLLITLCQVFTGLMATVFLAALDQVRDALPF
jgi:hypothetical protein